MGFIRVANEAMCRPIRALTQVLFISSIEVTVFVPSMLILFFTCLLLSTSQAKGHDTSHHVLACFGGAGGQHACAIARSLGMKTVFVHKYVACVLL